MCWAVGGTCIEGPLAFTWFSTKIIDQELFLWITSEFTNLGVNLDPESSFSSQVPNKTKTPQFHLRNITKAKFSKIKRCINVYLHFYLKLA